MADEFSMLDEGWRNALSGIIGAIRSDQLEGDEQRQRIREELMVTLGQAKAVMEASEDLKRSMQRIYEFLETSGTAHSSGKTLRYTP